MDCVDSDEQCTGAGTSGGSTSMSSTKKLIRRIRLLEQQVKACMESQPLLYQVFNKCNALEQRLKEMKRDVDGRLAEIDGGDLLTKDKRTGYRGGRNRATKLPTDDELDVDEDWQSGVESDLDFSKALAVELETDTKPSECKFCPGTPKQLFDDAEGLAKHYTSQHHVENMDMKFTQAQVERIQLPERKTQPTGRVCPECGILFSTPLLMKRHMETIHAAPSFTCKNCGKAFRRKDGLKSHRIKVHKVKYIGSRRTLAELPDGQNQNQDLDSNTTSNSGDTGNIPSEEGNSQMERDQGQGAEPAAEGDTDPLDERTCPKCSNVYGNRYHMKRHLETMHKAPSFQCDLCDSNKMKVFRRHDELKAHQLRVHGLISDAVKQATIRRRQTHSARARSLTMTKKAPATEGWRRPMPCTECGQLVTKNNMKKHMWVHMGLRPHVCETCGARFRDAFDLRGHQRRHNGDRPFICTRINCMKGFSSGLALKTHIMKSHQEDHEGVEARVFVSVEVSEGLVPGTAAPPELELEEGQVSVDNHSSFQDFTIT